MKVKTKNQLFDEFVDIRNSNAELQKTMETMRKEAENTQRKHWVLYNQLLVDSGNAVIVFDREETVLTWNPEAERLFGRKVQEALGKPFLELQSTGSNEEEIKEVIRGAFAGEASRTIETRWRRKDGLCFDTLTTISPLPLGNGEVVAVQATIKDITENKQGKETLRKILNELQDVYVTLAKAQESAIEAEKLAALGQLTAGVSHEILNSLQVITMGINLLLRNSNNPSEVVQDLLDMKEQANRITKIVHDLLSYSRHRPLERHRVNLNEVVERALRLVEHELKLKNIKVELDLNKALPFIFADMDQLKQVVINLTTNAIYATPEGGRIVLSTDEARPLLGTNGKSVELRVKDAGIGIDPKIIDMLFDPFFTTKRVGQGTGLGLSICRGIVDAHGGAIWLENAPGGGAIFIVRLKVGEKQ